MIRTTSGRLCTWEMFSWKKLLTDISRNESPCSDTRRRKTAQYFLPVFSLLFLKWQRRQHWLTKAKKPKNQSRDLIYTLGFNITGRKFAQFQTSGLQREHFPPLALTPSLTSSEKKTAYSQNLQFRNDTLALKWSSADSRMSALPQNVKCLEGPAVLASLLPLEDVGQHGAGCGQLTHLAQELGLGILAHQARSDGHGTARH